VGLLHILCVAKIIGEPLLGVADYFFLPGLFVISAGQYGSAINFNVTTPRCLKIDFYYEKTVAVIANMWYNVIAKI